MNTRSICILPFAIVASVHQPVFGTEVDCPSTYQEMVAMDGPVVHWGFESSSAENFPRTVGKFSERTIGQVTLKQAGPGGETFPGFPANNQAARFHGNGGAIRVTDPGPNSLLDFEVGDAITLEAWVNPVRLSEGQNQYIVGKGRTRNPGVAENNQNYAIRLFVRGGLARLSFLFRSAGNKDQPAAWHRWYSNDGFSAGSGWHHVAVTYTFGQADSLKGYINGREVTGKWDYAGKTAKGPVVDDDEVWIGSSLGANPASTFNGLIDEVAIYRHAVPGDRFRLRYRKVAAPPYITHVDWPKSEVLVEIMEKIPDMTGWDFIVPKPIERYTTDAMALIEVPAKYNSHGIRDDRSNPFMVRASARIVLPPGKLQILLRSRNRARLYVDDKLVGEVAPSTAISDGHNSLHKLESSVSPAIRPIQPGDRETVAQLNVGGGEYRFQLDTFAGGQNRRPELGETSVAIARQGSSDFKLLSPSQNIPLTDVGWETYESDVRQWLVKVNQTRRREASKDYEAYWQRRHDWARDQIKRTSATNSPEDNITQPHIIIDRFINESLQSAGLEPTAMIDDWSFLRRVTVDVIGTLPTPAMIHAFRTDDRPDRRARWIDRLLDMPGWADNWMGYWLDVLAENPNIINPTLNNTGPFRWWLHEALTDNKPFDRFVTELLLMEGSSNAGGTAGFAIASENDAPLAAKAHIAAQAFLAVNLQCARCHDAPFHDVTQRDTFRLAAMLNRKPLKLPKTSTVPGDPEAHRSLMITVSLKPGEIIKPIWPFARIMKDEFPAEFLENPEDPRERLAALITTPSNSRFAKVIANRLWQRYMGRGLVESVDDWEDAAPTHPELLDYLARELMTHDYDLKHMARLILNTDAYQRSPTSDDDLAAQYAGPLRRRMTAEQITDSLFTTAGKAMNTEQLNIDVDGGRRASLSINLGTPTRAWQFTSLSNERDRPSLSLPAAQTVINLLEAFGWRGSRQNPLSVRDPASTALQAAILANGVVAKRVSQFSEDSAFTQLALQAQPLRVFITQVFNRILTRPPDETELAEFDEWLTPGYETRHLKGVPPGPIPTAPRRDGVSWSNHLKPEANEIKVAFQKVVELGDPPTPRLDPDWRERAEDMVWTLINSPEFVMLP